jgi:hypothetical protein
MADWLNMLLGTSVIAFPWLLKYADDFPPAAWSAWIAGVAIMLFAAALYIPKAVEEIANVLLGVWVAVSPLVLECAADRDARATRSLLAAVPGRPADSPLQFYRHCKERNYGYNQRQFARPPVPLSLRDESLWNGQ